MFWKWYSNLLTFIFIELSPGSQRDKAKDRNERGETPLHIAAKKGDSECIRKLLDQGINPNASDFAGEFSIN